MLGNIIRRVRRWLSSDDDRNVYAFWDGQRERRADPMVVCRALLGHPDFDADKHLPLVDQQDDEAVQITVKAVRDAFRVDAFDGKRGLTEAECLELITDFLAWCEWVKKKLSTSPTSPEPTEPPPQETSAPSIDSDSGSTSPERSAAEPGA